MVSEKSSEATHFPFARAADQLLQLLAVVTCQRTFGPYRHLVAQHPRQQCQALVASRQRRGAQRHRMRRADDGDRADHPRMQHSRRPADQPTLGVAHQCRGLVTERSHQPGGVACKGPAVVAARRFVAAAVAAQVHGHHPRAGQPPQLVAPRPPERPEPVQQDDQRPFRNRSRASGDIRPSGGSFWSASTTWNRIPLACTSRWRHGPSMRTTDGSGGGATTSPTGQRSRPAFRRRSTRLPCRGRGSAPGEAP